MIIKPATGRSEDIEVLKGILERCDITARQRKQVEIELMKVRAGVKGELEAAHFIDDQYRGVDNFAVIHDLRIEHEGEVAQIDHLVINLGLQVFVCETKSFSSGLACNEHGEWVGFHKGKPFGISSPILQNERHIRTLERLFESKPSWMKTGLRNPFFESFVLVSNSGRIGRPDNGAQVDGLDRVMKVEKFTKELRRAMLGNVLGLRVIKLIAGMVSAEGLKNFAEGLASEHRPICFDYEAKFGIKILKKADLNAACDSMGPADVSPDLVVEQVVKTEVDPDIVTSCEDCGAGVDKKVRWFCRRYKSRFDGKILCRECQ